MKLVIRLEHFCPDDISSRFLAKEKFSRISAKQALATRRDRQLLETVQLVDTPLSEMHMHFPELHCPHINDDNPPLEGLIIK